MQDVITKIWSSVQISTDACYLKTKFQQFTSYAPLSSFKKIIVSTPRLLRDLLMLSLANSVPSRLKDLKCKKIALSKRPPIPYLSKKDCVKDTVFAFKDNHLKTQIGNGTEL